MPTPVTSPQDATGFAAEQRARSTQKATREQKDQITKARAEEKARNEHEIHDPTNLTAPIVLDEIEEVGVRLSDDSVIIRTIVDIEEMTYGVGTSYTFRAGQKYKVSRDLAAYLETLGYVWRPV